MRPVSQAVKTPASHAGNEGSIPSRVTEMHTAIFLLQIFIGQEKVWVRIPVGKEQPMV